MTYLVMLGLIVFAVGIGYIYIQGNYQELFGKFFGGGSSGSQKGGPVDDFLAFEEPEVKDEPKVISIGDFEAEKAKRGKKKD